MKRYAEYKDSGIEWIGEIPEGWELITIGRLYQERNEKVSDVEYQPLSVTKNGVVPQLSTAAKTDNGDNRKLVKKADFVINSRSDRRGSCGISSFDGSVSLINVVLFPNEVINNTYYSYLFQSGRFSDEFYRWGRGIVDDLWSTKWSNMKNILVPMPIPDIQEEISNFLNVKISAIDTLIADKQKLIDLLKEERQAIISEAVTKGLDKTAKMKDSGIEWIGKIPEGWENKKFSYLFSFGRGLNITKSDLIDEGIPCVNYGEIHSNCGFEVISENNQLRCVNNSYLESSPQSLLLRGDFVFADTSEDVDGTGNFTCLNSDTSIFAGYHSIIARQKKGHNYRYLSYLFDSVNFRSQVRCRVSGIKVFSITQSILKDVFVLLPSKNEQENIAKYLDRKTISIDTLISDIQTQIEKLKEYRQSLINEVVTGKVAI